MEYVVSRNGDRYLPIQEKMPDEIYDIGCLSYILVFDKGKITETREQVSRETLEKMYKIVDKKPSI